jgi:hypothetical protein
MQKKTLRTIFHLSLALACASLANAQTTAFTYQGKLTDNGNPANGSYTLTFRLYNDATLNAAANLQGTYIPPNPLTAVNGMFTTTLNFGAAPFTGQRLWLEIEIDSNPSGPLNPVVTLSPRTELTSAPYAITAQSASTVANGAIGASQLAVNAVGPLNLQANSVTSAKIASGQVVKSLNGLTDNVTLSAGANVSLTPNGNGLTINSSGSGAFSLNGTYAYYNSGNVGIGTSTPGGILSAAGPGLDGSIYQQFSLYADTTYGLLFEAPKNAGGNRLDYTFSWRGGGPAMTIQGATHNVGIGTTTPQSLLHLNSPNSSTYITIDKASVSYESGLAFRTGGSSRWWVFTDNDSDDFKIESSGEVDNFPRIQLPSANHDILLGLSGGNVGIGTTIPRHALDVNGEIAWAGSLLGSDQTGNIELGNSLSGGTTPYIDFHYGVGADQDYNVRLINDADGQLTLNGSLRVNVLTITGGADLAEPFQMSTADIAKGSLVAIDKEHPGRLTMSARAYDKCLAGIISGANGIKPGISLHQEGALEGGQNVALTGRVYALADASNGPIEPGDLLTSSDTPGHCMKATDPLRAQGAVIGKAMSALASGKGMVLVLVSLQ